MPRNGDEIRSRVFENGCDSPAARFPIYQAPYEGLKNGRAAPWAKCAGHGGHVPWKAHECVTVSMLRPLWAAEEPSCGAARAGGGAAMPFAGAAAG